MNAYYWGNKYSKNKGTGIKWQQNAVVSCTYDKQYLPNFGYSEAQVDQIYEIIMATKIPRTPTNLLAQI